MKAAALLPALAVAALLGGAAAAAEAPPPPEEVATLLAGTFDSKAQAEADPKAPGAARLLAARVPKSRFGDGAPVLYVEQALLTKLDRPWRQRFYRFDETADGGVVARVFEPKEPRTVSGKWRDPSDLALYGRGDVVERIGCAVRLRRQDGGWSGTTEGTNCPSAIGGARYAKTELNLSPGRVEWWERGYDVRDFEVPGSATRPTVYERRSDGLPSETAKGD